MQAAFDSKGSDSIHCRGVATEFLLMAFGFVRNMAGVGMRKNTMELEASIGLLASKRKVNASEMLSFWVLRKDFITILL